MARSRRIWISAAAVGAVLAGGISVSYATSSPPNPGPSGQIEPAKPGQPWTEPPEVTGGPETEVDTGDRFGPPPAGFTVDDLVKNGKSRRHPPHPEATVIAP